MTYTAIILIKLKQKKNMKTKVKKNELIPVVNATEEKNGVSIKTKKIKLIPVAAGKEEKRKIYKFVKNMVYDASTMCNKIIRNIIHNLDRVDYYMEHENISKSEAIERVHSEIGTSLQNSGYRIVSDFKLSSNIKTCLNQDIYKKINKSYYEIKQNEVSIPSFKLTNTPIMISNKIYKQDGSYFIDFPLTSEMRKKHGKITFELFFGKDKSGNKVSVDRALNGTYKMCNSSLQYKDGDIFLNLVIKMPKKINNLDENKIMGIDLGISRIITFHITNQPKNRHPKQLTYDSYVVNKKIEFAKKRNHIQKDLVFARGGHGRKRKLGKLNTLNKKASNWAKTTNHEIARRTVEIALANNVGVIKMEDLSGISSKQKPQFLKHWGYYDIQEKIKEKADAENMKILWVKSKNTSIKCPVCGEINKDNRLIHREENKSKSKDEINASMFECVNITCPDFDVMKNADDIAAINIANKEGYKDKPKSKQGRMKKVGLED